eukprot:g33725.t1
MFRYFESSGKEVCALPVRANRQTCHRASMLHGGASQLMDSVQEQSIVQEWFGHVWGLQFCVRPSEVQGVRCFLQTFCFQSLLERQNDEECQKELHDAACKVREPCRQPEVGKDEAQDCQQGAKTESKDSKESYTLQALQAGTAVRTSGPNLSIRNSDCNCRVTPPCPRQFWNNDATLTLGNHDGNSYASAQQTTEIAGVSSIQFVAVSSARLKSLQVRTLRDINPLTISKVIDSALWTGGFFGAMWLRGDVPLFFCAQFLPQAGAALHLVCIAIPKFKNP